MLVNMKNNHPKRPLNPQEKVLYEGNAVYVKSKYVIKQGTLYITSERIVFERRPMFKLLGIVSRLPGRQRLFTFQLSHIAGFQQAKFGLFKRVVKLELTNGIQHHFSVGKWEDIAEAYHTATGDTSPISSGF